MKPEELTGTVRDLHERAFDLRVLRNSLDSRHATIPASFTTSLRTAAQGLDDAASGLLNAYGQPLPDGVL